MATCGFKGMAWRIALSALMTVVLALAPLVVQMAMAAHAHATGHAAGHFHDNNHGQGHAHKHYHSGHAHAHGHLNHGDQSAGHSHDGAIVDQTPASTPAGNHDQGDCSYCGCCCTLCHAAVFLTTAPQVPCPAGRPSFPWLNSAILAAHDPGQPQRPPSRLPSL